MALVLRLRESYGPTAEEFGAWLGFTTPQPQDTLASEEIWG